MILISLIFIFVLCYILIFINCVFLYYLFDEHIFERNILNYNNIDIKCNITVKSKW